MRDSASLFTFVGFLQDNMNLEEKSKEVRGVFQELDQEIKAFLGASHLTCLPGCGFCCSNPKVSASVLEFLPLAFDLYEKGKAEKALELLESKSDSDWCIIYKATSADGEKGFCSDYQNRGLICRLFSSSYRTNKAGRKEIITCKKIKSANPELFETAAEQVNVDMPIPSSAGTYAQLYNIDFQLTNDQMPINQAIRKALELVLNYCYYRDMEQQDPSESL